MSNAIVRQTQTPASLGTRDDIREVQERIIKMMPGALEAPTSVVLAAAQIAVAHGLDPFNGEIYIMKVGRKKDASGQWVDDWRTHVGVKGLRRSARRIADFMTEFEDMDSEQVAIRRREDYAPEDIGVRCILYRLDLAKKCKDIGIPYRPAAAEGYWRKKAQWNSTKQEWREDNIPETWMAQMVAKKRAEINAIKEAFDLDIPMADPATYGEMDDESWQILRQTTEAEHRDRAMLIEHTNVTEDEDGMMWAIEPIHTQPQPTNGTSPEFLEGLPNDSSGTTEDNPFVDERPARQGETIQANTLKRLHAVGGQLYGDEWSAKRPELVKSISTGAVTSSKELLEPEARRLIAGMEAKLAKT